MRRMRHPHSPVVRAALVVLLACAGVTLGADPSTTSSLRWQVHRPSAMAVVDSTIYVATADALVPKGTGGALARFSTLDAVTRPSPAADNAIFALASDGAGGWYVGGLFATIGGVPRQGLARVLANGTVDPNFAVTFAGGSFVSSLLVAGSQLVVGGGFTSVNGVPRVGVAILDAATGAVLAANPVIDGGASALALAGSTLLVGGDFALAGGEPRQNLAAFSLATGALLPAFTADATDRVTTIVSDGTSVFVAGFFTTVNGEPRAGVAKVALATGAVDTAWNPAPDGAVATLAISGTTVYAGGEFTTIGGQSRANLAALDASSGAATTWRADTDGGVQRLAVDGPAVYLAGTFEQVNGVPRRGGARISTGATASVLPWYPGLVGGTLALSVAGGEVAVGGLFDGWHAAAARGLAAIDMRTGDVAPWTPAISGPGVPEVLAITAAGTQLIIGGEFEAVDGLVRQNLAAFDLATRALLPLSITIDGRVRTIAAIGEVIYVGGSFTTVNGQTRSHLFAMDVSTGQLLPWAPSADLPVSTIVSAGGRLFVGGAFTTITDTSGVQARAGLAELTTTGLVAGFDAQPSYAGVGGGIDSIAVDGTRLFLTGSFESIRGVARERSAAVDVNTAALLAWHPRVDSGQTALAVHRGSVYLAGGFTSVGGQPAQGLARVDDNTGALVPWTPSPAPTLGLGVRAVEAGLLYVGSVAGAPALERLHFYPEEALDGAPGAPADVTARIDNGTVSLAWTRAMLGAAPTGYVLEAGSVPGASNIATSPLAATTFTTTGVPAGTYYLRVRAVNAAGMSAPSREVMLVAGAAGCVAVPPPPAPPLVSVTGSTATLTWQPSPGASTTNFTLRAGSADGLANLATLPLGGTKSYTASGLSAGVYFVRVAGGNGCGGSGASPDAVVRVGGAAGPPTAPVQFSGTASTGGVVVLSWRTPGSGGVPTSHVLDVGTAPGLSNLVSMPLGAATTLTVGSVPSGTYYLRLRAVNAAGASGVSGELVLVVP